MKHGWMDAYGGIGDPGQIEGVCTLLSLQVDKTGVVWERVAGGRGLYWIDGTIEGC